MPDEPTLDVNTLKWRAWAERRMVSQPQHPIITETGQDNGIVDQPEKEDTGALYNLTKNEFRKLTEQLRDVSWTLGSRFRGLGFNRFKGEDHPEAHLHRSQLAASCKVVDSLNSHTFNSHQWEPYKGPTDTTFTRCRPVSTTAPDREQRPRTTVPLIQSNRPKSSPILHSHTAKQVSLGDYDMLNTDIISSFSLDKNQKLIQDGSKFGEKLTITGVDSRGEHREVLITRPASAISDNTTSNKRRRTRKKKGSASSRHSSSTSGVASDSHGSDSETSEPESDHREDDDENKSDDERIPEPKTPNEQLNNIPQIDWGLRPDKLDHEVVIQGRKDRSRYDFDASTTEQPEYTFSDVFSPALHRLDLRSIAEREASLDLKPTLRKDEAITFSRCFEFEKLQLGTERQEDLRRSRFSSYTRLRSASTALSRARAQSARNARNSRNCTQDCMQIACVGDCPNKYNPDCCRFCKKRSCPATCAETPYDNHARGNNSTDGTYSKLQVQRPKSCSSCSKENTSKILNANQIILGRPKSGYSTYSHGRRVARQTLDLRPRSPQLMPELITEQLDKISVKHTRPATRVRSGRPRGRDAVMPHKTYQSQRKFSLTAASVKPVFGVQPISPKRRARSAKSVRS